MFKPLNGRAPCGALAVMWTLLAACAAAGQAPDGPRPLPEGGAFERALAGGEAHRYAFDLRAGELFQVRVEQNGVDVTLRLLDAGGAVLATMDSPNDKEGPETLTFVAPGAGRFVLEVGSLDAKSGRGTYTLRRAPSRAAAEKDRRRVEVERRFAEGMAARNTKGQADVALKSLKEALAGWEELGDDYLKELTARQIKRLTPLPPEIVALFMGFYGDSGKANEKLKEAQRLGRRSRADALPAMVKANEALSEFRALGRRLADRTVVEKIAAQRNEELVGALRELQVLTKVAEASSMSAVAHALYELGEWEKRVECYQQVIKITQELLADEYFRNSPRLRGNYYLEKVDQASAFMGTGQMLYVLGQPDKAVEFYAQALQAYRSLSQEAQGPDFALDRNLFNFKIDEALVLTEMGNAYSRHSGNRPKAIDAYSKAVEIYKGFPDQKRAAASGLLLIANRYGEDLNYDAAFKAADESLKFSEELNDKSGQSSALALKGILYYWLNDKPKVNEIFNKVIEILQARDFNENAGRNHLPGLAAGVKAGDGGGGASSGFWKGRIDDAIERERLQDIATAYKFLEDFQRSNEYYERALSIARANRENREVRATLGLIAFNYASLKQWDKAAEYYRQALANSRRGAAGEDLADDLRDVGWALLEAGKFEEALGYQTEALVAYQSAGVDEGKAFTLSYSGLLNELARTHYALGNRRLAIFYGKRAVNAMQGERRRIQNLDPTSQKGFLERREKHYRRLADWLIEEGRFAQAGQVLRMLKEEEYANFVRRDPEDLKSLNQRVSLSKDEQRLIERYSALAGRAAEIGQQFLKLDEKRVRLPEGASLPGDEEARYKELSAQLTDANAALQLFLNKVLVSELGREAGARAKKEIEYDRNLQNKLRRWGAGTVTLRTVVTENRYRVILTTPAVQVDGKTEIAAAELNGKVFAFRDALQHPSVDPRPLGKELYDILIKPVEKDLLAAGAQTLVWSLDGTLRYVPLAALSPDGESYLVEKYRNVVITAKTADDISDSGGEWRALGVGVSEAWGVPDPERPGERIDFTALPGTREELSTIVRDERKPDEGGGVLPGRRYLDKDFTALSLSESLGKETPDGRRKYTVVHIAGHFRLGSNDSNSFLLLGDGQVLTLNQLSTSPGFNFGGVELVTLSACNTAFADESDGNEVDSLAEAIQTKDGKAVLATLWSVADESTRVLMSEFYRLRKENPGVTKVGALQLAQLEMIRGGPPPAGGPAPRRGAELAAGGQRHEKRGFQYDKSRPYAHPYYWAPFVLIGNWT